MYKFMIKCVFTQFLLLLTCSLIAQGIPKENTAINSVFWGTRLVDAQTTNILDKGAFSFEIVHRFETIASGISNMYGVYGSSNIAMGFEYGLLKNLQVSFLSEKMSKTQELTSKYCILQQNIDHSVPISLVYNTSLSIDARAREKFGEKYRFTNRLFYTHQMIVSKQIAYTFNVAAWLSFVHFNKVDPMFQADKMEVALAFGYRLNRNKTLFIRYMYPWDVGLFSSSKNVTVRPKPGISLGFETGTLSHNLQVFLTTREQIGLAKGLLKTTNGIAFKNLRLGFNIKIKVFKHKK